MIRYGDWCYTNMDCGPYTYYGVINYDKKDTLDKYTINATVNSLKGDAIDDSYYSFTTDDIVFQLPREFVL